MAMFCGKCGMKIEDENSKVCPNCGSPLANAPSSKAKNFKKIIPITVGVVCVLIIAIVAIAVVLSQPVTIDLDQLVEVNFTGYNTVGTATASIDYEQYDQQLSEALNVEPEELYLSLEYSACTNAFQISLNKASNLSNGDEVTVSITYDNESIKDYKVQFSGESLSFTVEGLDELEEIDPYEGLEVTFGGISPDGYVDYVYTGTSPYVSERSFIVDKDSNLKNGDTVTISIESYNEQIAAQSGYRLTETSKAFTVEGLDEYVQSYSEIPEEFLEYAKEEAQDTINAYVAREYSEECPLTPIEYAGYIFNVAKEGKDADWFNELYIIYRGTVSHNENEFHDTMVYYPVLYSDLLLSNNQVQSSDENEISGSSFLMNNGIFDRYTTLGYTNPIIAYSELLTSKEDNYECEAGDGFEKYVSYIPIQSLMDISEDNLNYLAEEALEIIDSEIANQYTDSSHATNMTQVGQYLLTAKAQGQDYQSNNRLIMVYSATVSNDEDEFTPATIYFPVQFEGLINLPGNEFMYVEESGVLGRYDFPNSTYYTSGYGDGGLMFKQLVTENVADYNYEVSDGLKVFGE